MKIGKRSFWWKCPHCGMTQRKEPHRTLRHHMEQTHGYWNDGKRTPAPAAPAKEHATYAEGHGRAVCRVCASDAPGHAPGEGEQR